MFEVLRDYAPGVMILGIPLFLGSALFVWRDGNLRRRGVVVQADCINHRRNSEGNTSLQLRFVVEGAVYTCETQSYRFPPAAVGEKLDVMYDPRDPRGAMMTAEVGSGRVPWVIGSVAAVSLVATAVAHL
ncbi:DUF3592 domain-containing protein [Streptomyces umbrinus]|jgi:hypothetical protein|uniref:DUF3592 domain-containing protein n=1 Tax=Streptomyces umbrinus TaxID=67370 RepID=UPI003C2F6538